MPDNRKAQKIELEGFCLHIAQLLIYIFGFNILLAAVFFAIGMTISWYLLPISFLAAVVVLVIFYGKKVDVAIIYEIAFTIMLLVFFIYISGKVYDQSYDGNAYHKLAVGLLKNNWNPIKSLPTLELTEGPGKYSGCTLWCEAYCKVTWIFAASIYAITGNIESGKAYTLVGMMCAFLLTVYFLKKKGNRNSVCVILALTAGLNPIAVQQMDSFYIDGFLHTVLYILVLSLLMLEDSELFNHYTSASLVAASMIVCGNIKFTGLLYGGIFCIVYYLFGCYKKYKEKASWFVPCLKSGLCYAMLAAVTIFWAGSSSYLTNLIHHGTFTYPLTGGNKVDIMSGNSPFIEANHFKNLFLSTFSYMDSFTISSNRTVDLKVPFTFDWQRECGYVFSVDSRLSGFGILFSGIIIIALIIIVVKLVRMRKDKVFFLTLLNVLVCLGLTFGIKESWWARYAPYIYFIVLISLFLIFKSDAKYLKCMGAVFAAVVLTNNCLPFLSIPADLENGRYISESIEELNTNGSIEVYNQSFEGIYFNLKDKGVNYTINNDLVDSPDSNVLGYGSTLWR